MSGHQKNSNFSVCKAQGNQHEIRTAFFERDKVAIKMCFALYFLKFNSDTENIVNYCIVRVTIKDCLWL